MRGMLTAYFCLWRVYRQRELYLDSWESIRCVPAHSSSIAPERIVQHTMEIGTRLTPLKKAPITQELLQHYADVSGDTNPLHLNEESARQFGFERTVAHGMLTMAFLGQFIIFHLKSRPGSFLISLQARFVQIVYVGDLLTCYGVIRENFKEESGNYRLHIECWVQNQKGETVTLGDAIISLRDNGFTGQVEA